MAEELVFLEQRWGGVQTQQKVPPSWQSFLGLSKSPAARISLGLFLNSASLLVFSSITVITCLILICNANMCTKKNQMMGGPSSCECDTTSRSLGASYLCERKHHRVSHGSSKSSSSLTESCSSLPHSEALSQSGKPQRKQLCFSRPGLDSEKRNVTYYMTFEQITLLSELFALPYISLPAIYIEYS